MNYSLYVHIPFCKHRCHYCDFNTFTGKESLIPAYIEALIEEVRIVTRFFSDVDIHSVYFGGGTPSLIPAQLYERLISGINRHFNLRSDCEISLEANPGTLSIDYLERLRSLGFNRISIGVQSTDPFDLLRLDRIHTVDDVLKTLQDTRRAGFENISLDMIFGLPWQNLSSWRNSLARAIELNPEHFSLYSLIIEPGTPLFTWYQKGLIVKQNQDLEAEMYELAMDMLESAGYIHYEISNWAKLNPNRDLCCRHNLQYWLNLPYFGVGAGAHGYLAGTRMENVPKISEYIHRLNSKGQITLDFSASPAAQLTSVVNRETQMKDFMLLGLRLIREGVAIERFSNTYGCKMQDIFHEEIDELIRLGLVAWDNKNTPHLKLTNRGVMLGNQVFMRFV